MKTDDWGEKTKDRKRRGDGDKGREIEDGRLGQEIEDGRLSVDKRRVTGRN